MYDKKIQWLYNFVDTILSIARMIGLTHFQGTISIAKRHDKCVIMGNGPSLIQILKENRGKLAEYDLIAVNFMGLSSEYTEYKPSIYVLCDYGFWFQSAVQSEALTQKVSAFYQRLADVTDWPLQIYIPYQAKKHKEIQKALSKNTFIHLYYYNKTKFEGYKWLSYWVYNRQWGMPRAQNVLHAALMLAIHSRYKDIYLAGADNDWIKQLWVDEKNRLRLNDTHFYAEAQKEDCILSVNMSEQCCSLYQVFKNYMDIKKYALYRKCKIYNLNRNSFIDAFEKEVQI